MSIASHIASLEGTELFRYVPKSTRAPKRPLFLTKEARKDFEHPQSATNLLVGRGFIEAALTRWTLGDQIYADSPKKGRFLKRLEPPPPEVWEVRITEPVVHARLLGRFAVADTLILMKFYTRRLLGDKGSKDWQAAMSFVDTKWSALFPGIPLFQGNSIHDYVTENCDEFKI